MAEGSTPKKPPSERGSYIALGVFLAVVLAFIVAMEALDDSGPRSFADDWDYVRPD